MWLAKLDLFAELERMMGELPEKYLESRPCGPEDLVMLPPGSKPISQLTEGEKRLYGLINQLIDNIDLDDKAHGELGGLRHKMNESCLEHHWSQFIAEEKLVLARHSLNLSMRERLGFKKDYLIDGYDIYAVPCSAFEMMRQSFEMSKKIDNEKKVAGIDSAPYGNWPTTKH